jgi:hypothetical protein
VLAELGAPGAASKLMGMDPAARASIIESMAPRAAADTLVSMEGALQVGGLLGGVGWDKGCYWRQEMLWYQAPAANLRAPAAMTLLGVPRPLPHPRSALRSSASGRGAPA